VAPYTPNIKYPRPCAYNYNEIVFFYELQMMYTGMIAGLLGALAFLLLLLSVTLLLLRNSVDPPYGYDLWWWSCGCTFIATIALWCSHKLTRLLNCPKHVWLSIGLIISAQVCFCAVSLSSQPPDDGSFQSPQAGTYLRTTAAVSALIGFVIAAYLHRCNCHQKLLKNHHMQNIQAKGKSIKRQLQRILA